MSIPNFKEEQKFTQWWIYLIVILSLGGPVMMFYNNFFAEGGTMDSQELIAIPIVFCVMLLVLFILLGAKLEVVIDKYSIKYKYFPFVWNWKRIAREEIANIELRRYSPLFHFGGWGYRVRPGKKKSITVKGNKAMLITMKNGRKLYIGTQKLEELQIAVDMLMSHQLEE